MARRQLRSKTRRTGPTVELAAVELAIDALKAYRRVAAHHGGVTLTALPATVRHRPAFHGAVMSVRAASVMMDTIGARPSEPVLHDLTLRARALVAAFERVVLEPRAPGDGDDAKHRPIMPMSRGTP